MILNDQRVELDHLSGDSLDPRFQLLATLLIAIGQQWRLQLLQTHEKVSKKCDYTIRFTSLSCSLKLEEVLAFISKDILLLII